jgi:ABC-type methionine transport system ATPase subunit
MRQQPIFLNDNVKNNILLPLKLRKVSKENQIRKINMVLDDYELSDIAEMNINELSVGQQQKVALARTMITEPEIVILDEPTNSLDMKNTRWFEDKIKLLIEEKMMIILWTSHDMNQVRRIAKYCSVIIEGEIRESGLVEDIFENAKDELVRAYLAGELI